MNPVRVVEQEERPFYTPKTLAKRLAVSERQALKMLAERKIASYRVERSRRIDPDDVDFYLARRRDDARAA